MNKNETYIFADYNATTPLFAAAGDAMRAAESLPLNPSSIHRMGRRAQALLEQARREIAENLDANGYELIFTSGGTEANNMAIAGVDAAQVLVSSIEHSSVLKPAESRGAQLIPVTQQGAIDLAALEQLLKQANGKCLVSVMLANNETGIIQPLAEVTRLVYQHGGFVHCDASQAVGKIAFSVSDLNCDLVTLSAHKFGGPKGVGALLIKKGMVVKPLIIGGGQQKRYRSGTENVAGIIGMGKAAAAAKPMDKQVEILRDALEAEILAVCPNAAVIGKDSQRLPNTSAIAMPNMMAETQVINFDLEGIMVSAGSACSSGKIEPSHVLQAMHISKEIAQKTVRFSFGPSFKVQEKDYIVECWTRVFKRGEMNSRKAA